MSGEHQLAVAREVDRLMEAFERGNSPKRSGAYARALQRVPIDRLERAVSWAIETHNEKSPPTIATMLRVAWKGTTVGKADDDADRDRLKAMCTYLENFSMADWYEFKRTFRLTPSAALYAKLEIRVPDGVTFTTAPEPAWCKAELDRALATTRAAFRRLSKKHGAVVPGPEVLAAEAERDARDAAQRAANEDLPW